MVILCEKNVSVIGLGVVGLTTAVGLALKGHRVTGVDIDSEKVIKIAQGTSPIYERELSEALKKLRINATTDLEQILDSDISFLCCGTPSNGDGSIDLRYMKGAAEQLAEVLKKKKTHHMKKISPKTLIHKDGFGVRGFALETARNRKSVKDLGGQAECSYHFGERSGVGEVLE